MGTVAARAHEALSRLWLVGVGLVLGVAAAAETASYPSGPKMLAGVLSVLTASAVVLRAWSLRLMTIAVALGLLALTVVGIGETPMWAFVELLLVSFWVAEGFTARHAAWAVALLVSVGIAFDYRSGDSTGAGSIVSPLVIVGAPTLAGALLRRSRQQAAQLSALTAELATQRDRAAAAAEFAERARIAREIHDVVAHTVSIMLVQAGAAQNLLPAGHPAAEPVGAIRSTGKQALAELRRVIGVLRSTPDDDTHPQPTLAALPELVVAARANGTTVELHLDGDLADVPDGVQLTVFRTVQEALTNARKHAPQAAIEVSVHRDDGRMLVRIDDDGIPASGAAEAAGFGLVGLRERAELYNATFAAGPRDSGRGWRVELSIPVPARPVQAAS